MNTDIISLSGDSTVSNLQYKKGQVFFKFEDYETDVQYEISTAAKLFYSESNSESGTVHINLVELKDSLPVETKSEIYVMPSEFKDQMKIVRNCFHLAIGLKSSEYPLMLVVQGNSKLLVCPVRSESDIKIKNITNSST